MTEAKWYILHTYSGYENKVMNNINTLVENRKLNHLIEEVMVPTEVVTEVHDGKTKQVEVKLFPSYVYVKMVMTDESWYICRNTRGVTGFVGPGSKPIPLTDEEVRNLGMTRQKSEATFKVGEVILINSGPLEGSEGVIKEIDEPNSKVAIGVIMFGRETPVTLDISGIDKIN
ncbi:MAG: transcription termination/antitermination protein NusG [Oscillospiraceae bacterium]|jgi:transcriptional antiterminator NusG|nr:transcription termination/antitermination protein NusG [Oscillospiraceae bacterium]